MFSEEATEVGTGIVLEGLGSETEEGSSIGGGGSAGGEMTAGGSR